MVASLAVGLCLAAGQISAASAQEVVVSLDNGVSTWGSGSINTDGDSWRAWGIWSTGTVAWFIDEQFRVGATMGGTAMRWGRPDAIWEGPPNSSSYLSQPVVELGYRMVSEEFTGEVGMGVILPLFNSELSELGGLGGGGQLFISESRGMWNDWEVLSLPTGGIATTAEAVRSMHPGIWAEVEIGGAALVPRQSQLPGSRRTYLGQTRLGMAVQAQDSVRLSASVLGVLRRVSAEDQRPDSTERISHQDRWISAQVSASTVQGPMEFRLSLLRNLYQSHAGLAGALPRWGLQLGVQGSFETVSIIGRSKD